MDRELFSLAVCSVCTRGKNKFPQINTSLIPNTSTKMLYLIGLGLSDERDITVRGLEVVRKCSRVYLEAYTSILLVDKAVLVSYPPTMPQEYMCADADM